MKLVTRHHNRLANRSGIVLVTVIILSITMALVAVSLMKMNSGQVLSQRSIVDSIQAEQIAIGRYYQYLQRRQEGCSSCANPGDCTSCTIPNEVLQDEAGNQQTFTVTMQDLGNAGTQMNDTRNIAVVVNF